MPIALVMCCWGPGARRAAARLAHATPPPSLAAAAAGSGQPTEVIEHAITCACLQGAGVPAMDNPTGLDAPQPMSKSQQKKLKKRQL